MRARHAPKVAAVHSHRGNFSRIPSPLLHRCNTFRVFESESERCVRSSLVFHIAPAQDHFSKIISGM
jgi:hypothetical protein